MTMMTVTARVIARMTMTAHRGEVNPATVSAQWQRQVKPKRRPDGEEGDDDEE